MHHNSRVDSTAVGSGLRIAYAIQNVGGINFHEDFGDTIPVKYTLRGLRKAGYEVSCLKLENQSVVGIDDVNDLEKIWLAPLGLSRTWLFKMFERGVRRIQKEMRLPYFAFFDLYRFYEACYRTLPGYDLCHEHNGLFSAGAALACSQLGIPYVLTVSAEPLFERWLGGRPLRGFHRQVAMWEAQFTYRAADRIICVSQPAKENLVENWQVNPEKIIVMPNGVDVDLFKPDYDSDSTRLELGLGDEPVISFIGSFQAWHGLDRLIESFMHVLKQFPNAKLLLVGDGRARQLVDDKIAEMGVASNVIITGFVPQEKVPEYLSVADVTVLPYPKLPMDLWFSPLKLYEYMAAGKAIVASRSGQIAEVLQDGYNGLLVEPGSVEELTRAILTLLNSTTLRDCLAQNARQQAVNQHSWDKYIGKLVSIYHTVLHKL